MTAGEVEKLYKGYKHGQIMSSSGVGEIIDSEKMCWLKNNLSLFGVAQAPSVYPRPARPLTGQHNYRSIASLLSASINPAHSRAKHRHEKKPHLFFKNEGQRD